MAEKHKPHDSDYCARRADQERANACRRWDTETVHISGDLALAYAALAEMRCRARRGVAKVRQTVRRQTGKNDR